MKSIERVLLPSTPTAEVYMPLGADILGVGIARDDRGEIPFIWVLADVDAERFPHTYWVLGSGPNAPTSVMYYIGSVTTADGYDFHIFDEAATIAD